MTNHDDSRRKREPRVRRRQAGGKHVCSWEKCNCEVKERGKERKYVYKQWLTRARFLSPAPPAHTHTRPLHTSRHKSFFIHRSIHFFIRRKSRFDFVARYVIELL